MTRPGDTPSSSFIRSLIVVEKGAQAMIAESHEGGVAQVNCALELVIGDDAQFDYFKATRTRGLHVGSLLATVGARIRLLDGLSAQMNVVHQSGAIAESGAVAFDLGFTYSRRRAFHRD